MPPPRVAPPVAFAAMTHTVIRVAELAEDTTSPIGYAPTGNQMVVTGTDEQPVGGHVFTVPIVRGYGLDLPRREQPAPQGTPATPEQIEALQREENGGPPSGLEMVRVHGEVQLCANLDMLRWLLSLRGAMVAVDLWMGTDDVQAVPEWDHTSVQLLRLRDLFVTFTGDITKHEVTPEREDGQDVVASTWYWHQRRTTTPPPHVPYGRAISFTNADGEQFLTA